ncbi:ERF family protein [Novosphingobium sp. KA1]|uniref:ERF family protein n=1 Tax=Novosphingobium sp. (strain KA1) TaxID=164608 RepID=UPI001A8CE3DD|nr:ERF family protein [Novosphingobium sp. KA1]QSR18446.1 hypothetical protein CA833_14830 [Novosphingobium sp. KA1]
MNAVTPIEATTGADVPAVYMAISNVMEQMAKEGIGKDRRNTQQGYNFRGIDDVYNALCGVLASNRLLMLPFVVDQKREERQSAKGGVLNYTILTVDFKLVSALDGSKDTVRMVGEAMDSADKSSNKAQSAAMKYAALQVFMIPTEGDNDADATTHDLAPRQQQEVRPVNTAQLSKLKIMLDALKLTEVEWLRAFGAPSGALLHQLPEAKFREAVDDLEQRMANAAKQQSNRSGAQSGDLTDDQIPY